MVVAGNTKSRLWLLVRVGGAGVVGSVAITTEVGAQNAITYDGTLGNEPSAIFPLDETTDGIVGGAVREQNLFHSFDEFSIGDGNGAFFITNSDAINNIFARVTGDSESSIQGLLGTLLDTGFSYESTDANLFLINPNGIVFGENSALSIFGSFTATTADSVLFGNEEFSALDREVPASILTVDSSAYLFTQQNPAAISSSSINNSTGPSGLRVANGGNITFLGGNINIDGGDIFAGLHAFGGRVELGAVGGAGEVGIRTEGNLIFPNALSRDNVRLTNQALIDVSLDGGGDITITADNISLTNNSFLNTGISEGLGVEESQAGDVVLNAEQIVEIEQSVIQNIVSQNATGNGGNIDIAADSIRVTDGGLVISSTFGNGNAGTIFIEAQDQVVFSGTSADGQSASTAFSSVEAGGVGKGGNIEITTETLEVLGGASLSAGTRGEGNSGSVIVNAQDRVVFSGASADGQSVSAAFSSIETGGTGRGGSVEITTGTLEVLDGAGLLASTRGQGNAGNILVVADSMRVANGGTLDSRTSGNGDAGSVIINTQDRVVFSGTSIDGQFASAALSSVDVGGVGRGGNVEIITDNLEVLDGAQLIASTQGEGDAGSVLINAEDLVVFSGRGAGGQSASAAFSSVEAGGVGEGGNIEITAGDLAVLDGAVLSARTFGKGDAGDVY